MPTIGLREFRQQTSELLRKVQEEKAEYIITQQGEPVAILLPLDSEAAEQTGLESGKRGPDQSWDAYADVAEQVRAAWPETMDTRTLLDSVRR